MTFQKIKPPRGQMSVKQASLKSILLIALLVITVLFIKTLKDNRIASTNEIFSGLNIRGSTMGSYYSIVFGEMKPLALREQLEKEINNSLLHLNQVFSTWDEQSEVSHFNKTRNTQSQVVSNDFMKVIQESFRASELLNGAFDITISPLIRLWGFGPWAKTKTPEEWAQYYPTETQIAKAKALVNYKKLIVTDSLHIQKLDPEIELDFSGIVPGFAADEISRILLKNGISNHLVDVGGEMHIQGVNPHGKPWQIGIEKPSSSQETKDPTQDPELFAKVSIKDFGSISTSGKQRNHHPSSKSEIHHIIDPRTGLTSIASALTVTVVTRKYETVIADALTTGLFVLGPEAGLEWAKQHPEIEVLYIVEVKEEQPSSNSSKKLKALHTKDFPFAE